MKGRQARIRAVERWRPRRLVGGVPPPPRARREEGAICVNARLKFAHPIPTATRRRRDAARPAGGTPALPFAAAGHPGGVPDRPRRQRNPYAVCSICTASFHWRRERRTCWRESLRKRRQGLPWARSSWARRHSAIAFSRCVVATFRRRRASSTSVGSAMAIFGSTTRSAARIRACSICGNGVERRFLAIPAIRKAPIHHLAGSH